MIRDLTVLAAMAALWLLPLAAYWLIELGYARQRIEAVIDLGRPGTERRRP